MRERLIAFLPESWPGGWLIPDPSAIWLLSLLVVFALSIRYAGKHCLSPGIMTIAGLLGILGAFLGGCWAGMLSTSGSVFEDPPHVLRLMQGDKGVCGALLGAAFCGWLYFLWKRTSFFAYADAASPAIALGYTLARIGCFLNGCCFGSLSDLPWAVQYPKATIAYVHHLEQGWVGQYDSLSLPVHPTPLYHAALGLAVYLILHKWQGKWPGSRLAFGLGAYGSLRFLIQFLRGDRLPLLGLLDINQIFSLLFILIAALLWWRQGRRKIILGRTIKSSLPDEGIQPEHLLYSLKLLLRSTR